MAALQNPATDLSQIIGSISTLRYLLDAGDGFGALYNELNVQKKEAFEGALKSGIRNLALDFVAFLGSVYPPSDLFDLLERETSAVEKRFKADFNACLLEVGHSYAKRMKSIMSGPPDASPNRSVEEEAKRLEQEAAGAAAAAEKEAERLLEEQQRAVVAAEKEAERQRIEAEQIAVEAEVERQRLKQERIEAARLVAEEEARGLVEDRFSETNCEARARSEVLLLLQQGTVMENHLLAQKNGTRGIASPNSIYHVFVTDVMEGVLSKSADLLNGKGDIEEFGPLIRDLLKSFKTNTTIMKAKSEASNAETKANYPVDVFLDATTTAVSDLIHMIAKSTDASSSVQSDTIEEAKEAAGSAAKDKRVYKKGATHTKSGKNRSKSDAFNFCVKVRIELKIFLQHLLNVFCLLTMARETTLEEICGGDANNDDIDTLAFAYKVEGMATSLLDFTFKCLVPALQDKDHSQIAWRVLTRLYNALLKPEFLHLWSNFADKCCLPDKEGVVLFASNAMAGYFTGEEGDYRRDIVIAMFLVLVGGPRMETHFTGQMEVENITKNFLRLPMNAFQDCKRMAKSDALNSADNEASVKQMLIKYLVKAGKKLEPFRQNIYFVDLQQGSEEIKKFLRLLLSLMRRPHLEALLES